MSRTDVGISADERRPTNIRADWEGLVFLAGCALVIFVGVALVVLDPGLTARRFRWIETTPGAKAAMCALAICLGLFVLSFAGRLALGASMLTISDDSIRIIRPRGYLTLTRGDIVEFRLSAQRGNRAALQIVCRGRQPINVTLRPSNGEWADVLPALEAWLAAA